MEAVAITEYTSQSGSTNYNHLIYGSTPYGDYLQMVYELSIQDADYLKFKNKFKDFNNRSNKTIRRVAHVAPKKIKRLEQLEFNEAFMTKVRDANDGKLHCVYCGKPNLIIFYHDQQIEGDRAFMATTDHFTPVSKGGDRFKYTNLFVSCSKCNQNKKDKIYSRDTLKYLKDYPPYHEIFEELKVSLT